MNKQFLLWTLALLGFSAPLAAQVDVTLEPVTTFGEFGFYQPTFPPNTIPPTGFAEPRGIAFLRSGQLVIADYNNLKVQVCDITGENCRWLGGDATFGRNQSGVFDRPHGVAVTDDGLVLVADEDNHWIQRCNLTGTCTFSGESGREVAEPSSGFGKWAFPNDVAADSQGRVYGLDTGNNRIQVLRADNLNFLKTFMRGGTAPGQLDGARGIAIDAQDRIIIADSGNHRIQVCDDSANCTVFGSQGSGSGQFDNPVGVDVDALGRIWVADTGNNRIQACDYDGNCVAFGAAEGYVFADPHDVAAHPSGLVAVADTTNNRIQVFSTEASLTVNPGLNDAWYEPATAGQGFFITVYPDIQRMFLAQFTFDAERPAEDVTAILGEPGHRWLVALGEFSGTSAELQATLTEGGIFDSGEGEIRETTPYGAYRVEVLDCNTIRLEYDLPAIPKQGTIMLERVVTDNVALCEALSAEPDTD